MNEVLATGIFTLVGVIIGAIINGLISFYSEKRQKKEQLYQKQISICLDLLECLDNMISNLPDTKQDLDDYHAFLKSPENSYKPKTTNSEMLLYLSEDIRTSFLVAYTFPQCALDDGMSPENVKSNTYIYRNTFIRMIREDMNIPAQENITKEQNKRFDKYFDEEKKKLCN